MFIIFLSYTKVSLINACCKKINLPRAEIKVKIRKDIIYYFQSRSHRCIPMAHFIRLSADTGRITFCFFLLRTARRLLADVIAETNSNIFVYFFLVDSISCLRFMLHCIYTFIAYNKHYVQFTVPISVSI